MGKYFGTDGFRGEAGRELTAAHAFAIGRFLGKHWGQGASVAIGKDTRRSSYTLEYALAAGLTASGANARLLHVLPTPAVAHLIRENGWAGGVMISASHNPYYDNGIKVFDGNGEKIDDGMTALLEKCLDGCEKTDFATGNQVGVAIDDAAASAQYAAWLLKRAKGRGEGLRVGLDAANGAAHRLAGAVFTAWGAAPTVIHNTPDGCNINSHCGSTHLESLRQTVLTNGLDAGFAFDGDADRCLAIDRTGRVIDGDAILYIMGKHLKAEGALSGDTVVATVMSNGGLITSLQAKGIACVQTPVGDKYVAERMRKNGFSLGGEQSGHIIFGSLSGTGDGLLTALLLADLMCRTGQTLQELAADYHPHPQLQYHIPVRDKGAVMADAAVQAAIQAATEKLEGKGRLLVRASGTEPVVRVLAEAENETLCRLVADGVRSIIEERGGVL